MVQTEILFTYEDEFFGYRDSQTGITKTFFITEHLHTIVYRFLNDPWLIMELEFQDVLKLFGTTIFHPDFKTGWQFEFDCISEEFSYSEKFNPKFNIPKSKKTYLDFWVDLYYDEQPIYYASAILAAWAFEGWSKTAKEIVSGWIQVSRTPLFEFTNLSEILVDKEDVDKMDPLSVHNYFLVTGNFNDFEYLKGLPNVTPEFLEQFQNSILKQTTPCYN
jgi:hypothetical protein